LASIRGRGSRNDHQIITDLIGTAAQLPAEDPRAARWATEALALASAAELPILIEEAEECSDASSTTPPADGAQGSRE